MRKVVHKILEGPLKNMLATIGAGGLFLAGYVAIQAYQFRLGELEVERYPVLAAASVCDGKRDPATGKCLGTETTYPAFAQTNAYCDGRDAIVSGTMSKVRRDAVYVQGRQFVYFGTPAGRFRVAEWQHPASHNRPVGVQDWGPWRLQGGCVSIYTEWFTLVEHKPWHKLYNLPTMAGPFPLPRAKID